MRKRGSKIAVAALAAALAAAGAGCAEDDGGSGLTAEIDAESVAAALQLVTTTIPQCVNGAAAADMRFAARAARIPAELAAFLADAQPLSFGLGSYAGSCTDTPGSLEIAQLSHEDGVTTISIVFDAYCTLSGATAKAPGEKTFLTGSATLVDWGEPSDSGPVVSRRTLETDGDGIAMTRVAADGVTPIGDKTIAIAGYERTYGTPYNYFAGAATPPSEAAPDAVAIASFVMTDNANGIETAATDIAVSMYETLPGDEATDLVVTVTRLVGSIGDSGTAAFATVDGDPLVIDSGHAIVAGSAEMTGASGSARIAAIGPSAFAIEVNGAPLVDGVALDCSAFDYEDFIYVP